HAGVRHQRPPAAGRRGHQPLGPERRHRRPHLRHHVLGHRPRRHAEGQGRRPHPQAPTRPGGRLDARRPGLVPRSERRLMGAPPDVVLILTDEERAAPPYEGPELAAWRTRTLTGTQWFHEHGVSFERHYTGSLACVPSRPTLFTGQYPD